MVSSKAATAILLAASAGSAMAAIPAMGQYTANMNDATTATAINGLTNPCDKACLTKISIAPNTAQTAVNMMGNSADTSCTCTTVTVPYTSSGLTFTGVTFSSGGVAFSGTGDATPVSSGTSSASTSKPTSGTGTSSGNSTSHGNMTMTSMTSATATATATTTSSSAGLLLNVRRRRDIFARAVGDTLTVKLTPAGGTTANNVIYVASGDAVGVTAPSSSHKTMYASAAAIVSAGVAAVIAGIVGF
ncbi:hypothetical protein HDU89_003674 [Geranomyces variabilis]|nr:hypothetical protein HDU89_003674 [Geranomyces variabilis]